MQDGNKVPLCDTCLLSPCSYIVISWDLQSSDLCADGIVSLTLCNNGSFARIERSFLIAVKIRHYCPGASTEFPYACVVSHGNRLEACSVKMSVSY